MNFKPYQEVMVLGAPTDDGYFDLRGRFIEIVGHGSNKGKAKVEVDTIALNFDVDQLCDVEEYFKAYNGDKTKLPARATGRLWFLHGS